jgi:hypothetical protein
MSTPMVLSRPYRPFAQPTLRTIAVAALVVNALTFLFDIFAIGPNEINVTHKETGEGMVGTLVVEP